MGDAEAEGGFKQGLVKDTVVAAGGGGGILAAPARLDGAAASAKVADGAGEIVMRCDPFVGIVVQAGLAGLPRLYDPADGIGEVGGAGRRCDLVKDGFHPAALPCPAEDARQEIVSIRRIEP